MYTELFGIIAGLLAAIAAIPYIIDIIKGKARPERASWFIWLVLAIIALTSQFAEGARASLFLTAADSLAVLAVFLMSIKYGEGGFTRRDIIGLIVAGIGLLLWYLTSHAIIALLFVIIVDSSGLVLTLIKTYQEPDSETYPMWIIISIAAIFGMLAVGSLEFSILIYPFYLFVANFSVVLIKFVSSNKHQQLTTKP